MDPSKRRILVRSALVVIAYALARLLYEVCKGLLLHTGRVGGP